MRRVGYNWYQVLDSTKVTVIYNVWAAIKLNSSAEREQTRKKYILSLENRTPEQILEEEALYVEVKRLEQNERKFKKDRDDLLRTLAGIDSGLPEIVEDDGAPLGVTTDLLKKKKKGGVMDLDSPSTPLTGSISASLAKRPQVARSAAYGVSHSFL